MWVLSGFLAVVNHGLLQHGEGLTVVGFVLGLAGILAGQKRFKPPGRNAQRGRWSAAHYSGMVLIILGMVGVVLMVLSEG
jgi:hypothetical protein